MDQALPFDPTDPCTNQHLRANAQSALLPRSATLPAAALAPVQPFAVRSGVCERSPEGFLSLQPWPTGLCRKGNGVDAGEAIHSQSAVEV